MEPLKNCPLISTGVMYVICCAHADVESITAKAIAKMYATGKMSFLMSAPE